MRLSTVVNCPPCSVQLVSWSLTSLFSTNTAISETNALYRLSCPCSPMVKPLGRHVQ